MNWRYDKRENHTNIKWKKSAVLILTSGKIELKAKSIAGNEGIHHMTIKVFHEERLSWTSIHLSLSYTW